MNKLFKISIIIVFFCGCKSPSQKIEPALEDKLIISFDAVVPMNDEFQLYYKKNDAKYTEGKSLKIQLKGSDNFQKIEFIFDQLVFPQNIRLDLGKNIKQKTIQIENFQFNYNGQKHVLTNQEFKKYFVTNKYLDANFDNLTFTPLALDGLYNPILSSYNISYFINKLILY